MTAWTLTWRADSLAAQLADRHYSRRTVGAAQFAPAGGVVPLVSECGRAVWVSWRTDFPDTEWARDAWVCTIFRNEGAGLSSDLIRDALAITRHVWGAPPSGGSATFVDPGKVRRKRDPGRCFRRAGFKPVGWTNGGHGRAQLLVLHLSQGDHPAALAPLRTVRPGGQLALDAA